MRCHNEEAGESGVDAKVDIESNVGMTTRWLKSTHVIDGLISKVIDMADVRQIRINVLEQDRFVTKKPVQTTRTFNNDFSIDTFTCPGCGDEVVITHWEDHRGVWPDVDLPCKACGRHWGILR